MENDDDVDDHRPFYDDNTLVVAWGAGGPFSKRLGDLVVGDLVCTGDSSLPGLRVARVLDVQRKRKRCVIAAPRGISMSDDELFELGGMVVARRARVLSSAPLFAKRQLNGVICGGVALEGGLGLHFVDARGRKMHENKGHSIIAGVRGEGGVGGLAAWYVATETVKHFLGEDWQVEVERRGRPRPLIRVRSPIGGVAHIVVRRDSTRTTFGTEAFVDEEDGRRFLHTREELDRAMDVIGRQHVASTWMHIANAEVLERTATERGMEFLDAKIQRNREGRPDVDLDDDPDIDDAGSKLARVYFGDSEAGLAMHRDEDEVPWAMPFGTRALGKAPPKGDPRTEAFEDAFAWLIGLHMADGFSNQPLFSVGLTQEAPQDLDVYVAEERFLNDDAGDAEYVHVLRGLSNFIEAAVAMGYDEGWKISVRVDERTRDVPRRAAQIQIGTRAALFELYEDIDFCSIFERKQIEAANLRAILMWRQEARANLVAGIIDGDGCLETQRVFSGITMTQVDSTHASIMTCFAMIAATLLLDCRVGLVAVEGIPPRDAVRQEAFQLMTRDRRVRCARDMGLTYKFFELRTRIEGPHVEDLPIRVPNKKGQNRDLAGTCRGIGMFAYTFKDGGERDTTYVKLDGSNRTMLAVSGVVLGVGDDFGANVKTS